MKKEKTVTEEKPILKAKTKSKKVKDVAVETQPKTDVKPKKMSKFKTKKLLMAVALCALIFASLYYFRALFVAAVVNGKPVSRLSVVRIKKRNGQNALDAIILKKLLAEEAAKNGINITEDDISNEIKIIEESLTQQGVTLEEALAQQGMTQDNLREQIVLQKQVEMLVTAKIQITDEEVEQYISSNKLEIPEEAASTAKEQIKQQLMSQRLNLESQLYIDTLKTNAKIQYFVKY